MANVGVRPATFRDAQAIDAIVEGFPPLRRDLDAWVNQAEYHVALVDDTTVVGFAARTRQKPHPLRDLVSVYVQPSPVADEWAAGLYRTAKAKRALKVRLPADDDIGLEWANAAGFTERIRSATYRVPAYHLAGASDAVPVDASGHELVDALGALYEATHTWDPPATFTRRYIRQSMVLGAEHLAITVDDDALITGVGIAHRSDDPHVAADISLVGALDPDAPDADAITRSLVAHLASFYVHADAPLWFEVDTGAGTNTPLARLITPMTAAEDEVVILTDD
jgi:hypothetical protein